MPRVSCTLTHNSGGPDSSGRILKAPECAGYGHVRLYVMCVVGKAVPRICFSLDLFPDMPSHSF